jgi:tRNA/tmRNA/rRNA uracil-C5-methylase (TrmA/RlmC/RlmD family)
MEYGSPADDVWDLDKLNSSSKERIGYPTQKPLALIERIIKVSSNEGDVVLDAFCGSGTTLVAAQRLNRKFIGIDQSKQAISISRARIERRQAASNEFAFPQNARSTVTASYFCAVFRNEHRHLERRWSEEEVIVVCLRSPTPIV